MIGRAMFKTEAEAANYAADDGLRVLASKPGDVEFA
jgi:hypothetical protein